MRKFSTRCMNEFDSKPKSNPKQQKTEPKKATLDFIKQFARVYQVEPQFSPGINAYILN